jgi:hypothetical protein
MASLYIFFGSEIFVERLNNYIGISYWKKVIFIGGIFILYAIYVVGTGDFPKWIMARTIIYLGFPLIILWTLKESKQHLVWQDFLVIAYCCFKIEFGWV